MPYTFVNFTLQKYIRSRAEGEAIVCTTDDLLTTAERQTTRMAHNECFYLARGTTMHAERLPTLMRARRRRNPHGARRSVATERPREGAIATEQPNDKHPAWFCGVAVGAGRGRKRGRRGNEGTRRPTAPRDDGAQTSPLPADGA